MTTLGFENYVGPLKNYLNKYRENEGDEKINESMALQGDQSPTNLICHSYSFGTPKSLVNINGAFNSKKINENGDGNGNRIMGAHLHHEVEW